MGKKFLLIVSLFATVSIAVAQKTNKPTEYNMIQVNNDIYMLQGKGGNIGLCFGDDGIFMIDDQFADGIEEVKATIQKKSKKPIQFLVNTHFHGDHTGGNPAMTESGTIIFSQDNVRTRLNDMMKQDSKKTPKTALPMITFSENLNFHYNNEDIIVFHIKNAHTDGDAMIYFKNSNVLHTGDVFFNGKYPYIDLDNGGSVTGYIQGLKKASQMINGETKIIPGHGPVGNLADMNKTEKMLSDLFEVVSAQYKLKKTEEEVAKMTNLTKKYDDLDYGSGFISTEKILRTIYKDIANKTAAAIPANK